MGEDELAKALATIHTAASDKMTDLPALIQSLKWLAETAVDTYREVQGG